MPVNQVPILGVPFTSLVNVTDVAQRPVMGALVDLTGTQDDSVTLTGVAGTGGVGTVTPSLSPGTLVGVGGTGGVGTVTPSLSPGTLVGVAGTSAIGSMVPEVDTSLTGVAGTSGVGTLSVLSGTVINLTGLEADTALGSVTPEIDLAITGQAATTAIGSLVVTTPTLINITGLAATAALGTVTPEIDVSPSGRVATASIGTIAPNVEAVVTGVGASTFFTAPFVTSGPNYTPVTLGSLQLTASLGQLSPHLAVPLTGVAAGAEIGTPSVIQSREGLTLTGLECTTIPPVEDTSLSIRWSDTDGYSWSDSVERGFASTGAYLTSIQVLRLGLSRRGRVFSISWSAPAPTALAGASVKFEVAGT